MAPSSPAVAAFEAVIVAAAALSFGRLVVDGVVGRRAVDGLTRWALALPGLVLFSFLMMLLHIVTGGAVLSNAWLTRGLTVIAAAALIALRVTRRSAAPERRPRWQWLTVIGTCLLGVVVWGWPITKLLPLNFWPDTNVHMGWASQLLAGESTPSALITGKVPNYYPWLYHGLVALLARFTPGGRALDTLGALQLLQVVGVILTLFALGCHMTRRFFTGAAAAFFGALSGGFGIGMLFDPSLRHRAVDLPATKIPWLGDLLSRRPYNFAFNNIAPAYPRDLSFSLLVAFLLLLVLGLNSRSHGLLVGAGVLLGLVGLAGGEAVIVGVLVAAVVCLVQGELPRGRALAAVLLPTLLVWGTWLVPLVVSYVRLGGFVNTTHIGPVVLTFPYLLLSWSFAIPFAVVGLLAGLREWRRPAFLAPLAIVVVTAAIMASNVVPEAFGNAFFTLGRDHRYWALCELGVALLAAWGATAAWDRVRRFQAVAASAAALIVLLGIVSPALSTTIYPEKDPAPRLVEASLEGRPTLLNALARADRSCVVAVSKRLLVREIFGYTGDRLVRWVDVPGLGNDARIRWRDIYRHIPGDPERNADNALLTGGQASPARWKAVARKYGVNFLVVPTARAGAPAFQGLRKESFTGSPGAYTLVWVKAC